jgi:hypothetical protein
MKRDLLGLRLGGVVNNLQRGPPDGGREDDERGQEGGEAVLLDLLPVGVEVGVLGVGFGPQLDGDSQLLAHVQVNLEELVNEARLI